MIAAEIIAICKSRGIKLSLAESCTGGLVAAAITAVSGASAVFDRGFITYSNQAKIEMLGVRAETLEKHGAVSAATAEEMAIGALNNSGADIAASITGIAGPTGGTKDKPVGLVFIAISPHQAHKHHFTGTREEIRKSAVEATLNHILNILHAQTNANI
jgi:nicotinamide-nucleotide amidase